MTHSKWNNLFYIIRNWIRWDMWGTIAAIFRIPIVIVLPIVTALIPRFMVNAIQTDICLEKYIGVLVLGALIVATLSAMDKILEARVQLLQYNVGTHYSIDMMDKLQKIRYDIIENYDVRALCQRCKRFACEGMHSDGAWAVVRLTGLATGILGIVTYSVLFSTVNPMLLVIVLLSCTIEYYSYYMSIKYGDKAEHEMTKCEMIFYYLYRLASDSEKGKDIRLSNAADWLIKHLKKAAYKYIGIMHWYTRKATELTGLQVFCTIIRDAATFAILVGAMQANTLLPGDFLFFFSLTTGFSDWLNGISGHISSLQRITLECDYYRSLMELPETYEGSGSIPINKINSIKFRNVCFSYESGGEVLKGIDFEIHAGESIAIVGENGAGKTTLIKLLCGLYQPTEGAIYINNIDLKDLDIDMYLDAISAVFQDYFILPTSVEENILLDTQKSENKLNNVLQASGLIAKDKTAATTLSGGEKQKVLLARALYHKSDVLVLDEPAAALDPLAEEKLYLQYKALADNQMSVFVSHRLITTQFCNRIIYLSEGRIVEMGSHEELLQKNGEYRKMYEAQGYYYKEVRSFEE